VTVPLRILQNHTIDSTRWNHVSFRAGDIVIASWAKSGTTWIQQIVGQLLFNAAEDVPIIDMCPWVEQRYLPIQQILEQLTAQTHRRFMKTHLPADALALAPSVRFIYIARDGRDALWSWQNHHLQMTPKALRMINEVPGRIGPPLEPAIADSRLAFRQWLERDGYPIWPFWSNVQSWWIARNNPNVLLLHFNNLKTDMHVQIERIARFLGIRVDCASLPRIMEHCSFDYMKSNGARFSTALTNGFANGASSFFHSGVNGRWRTVLSKEDLQLYESYASAQLSPACARWLATGERAGVSTQTTGLDAMT
jgi:aryl sulfotransferase